MSNKRAQLSIVTVILNFGKEQTDPAFVRQNFSNEKSGNIFKFSATQIGHSRKLSEAEPCPLNLLATVGFRKILLQVSLIQGGIHEIIFMFFIGNK